MDSKGQVATTHLSHRRCLEESFFSICMCMHFIKIRSAELPSRILPAIEFIGCLYRKERKTTRLTPQKKQVFFSPSTCRTIPVEYGCVGHIPTHLWSGSLHRGVRGKCPGVRGAYGMWRSNSVCSGMFAMKWVCIQECSPDWSVSLLFESFWQFLDTKGSDCVTGLKLIPQYSKPFPQEGGP